MYVGPLARRDAEILAILLGDVALQTHAIQRPLVPVIQTQGDLLVQ